MIYGIGIDVEETARFRRLVSHVAGLARVYGPAELAELQRRGRLDSYAANFCAKEAFSKALGTGVRGFSLNEAELLRD
ncbi:MAG: 4'-phosphopantetheinyl transferase superfamily protein, partial [Clostridia bacterium]|nr:4'-phosphopantetheinyl transferase superfamily protein [Clostridia bacterium]